MASPVKKKRLKKENDHMRGVGNILDHVGDVMAVAIKKKTSLLQRKNAVELFLLFVHFVTEAYVLVPGNLTRGYTMTLFLLQPYKLNIKK